MKDSNKPSLHNPLVRYSRAGDAFHYRWAARRCLRLIDPKSALTYITVESSSESNAAGEYIIDLAEYSENDSEKKQVIYVQLKHSTVRSNRPFAFNEIKDSFVGFAMRYASGLNRHADGQVAVVMTFKFVSNRTVSPRIKQALDHIRSGLPAKNALQRSLQNVTKLKGAQLQNFYQSVSIADAEGDYIVQKRSLQGEMQEYIAGFVESGEVDQLIALVADRALPKSEGGRGNGQIWREDVLQRLGVTSERQLFPAPPAFETLPAIIKREQHDSILNHILQKEKPTIVHAVGGVGKSVVAQQLAASLPTGSIGMLYDCFGAGKYRNPSEPRHRAQDALVQITNELAIRGLCQPLICRSGTQQDELFRGFKERLSQAGEKLREVNKLALLVLLIDAADNAEMAAHEYNDKCFAGLLLREDIPTGCRLVMFCRTERIDLLAPPSSVHLFQLDGFSVQESAAHLRQQYSSASDHDVLEFHRLSGGNPRVQAYALNGTSHTLNEILSNLGPTKTTVDDQIYEQLDEAVRTLKDKIGPTFKDQVDSICRGLANLPPFIPLEVLAAAAAVDVSAIKSFISDLGRPLWHSDDSVQFRDEPTETWFRKTFAANKAQISNYVASLEPLAKQFPYVARVLPQLLLQAENYHALVELALSDNLLPENSPIDARNIRVYRLQYAFRAALRLRHLADAAKLAFRAGEEVAGDQRQLQLLKDNVDLIGPLQDVSRIEELAHRQVFEGSWPGSQNLYSASILSAVNDYKGEARSFLRAAQKWLRVYFETRTQLRKENPEHSHFTEQLTTAEISEFLWTTYNLYGAEEAGKYAMTWKPSHIVFEIVTLFIRRLITASRFDDVDRVAKCGANNPHLVLALTDELAGIGKFPPVTSLKATLKFLNNPKSRPPKATYISHGDRMPSAILSFAEACAAQRLPKRQILSVLEFYTEPIAHSSMSETYNPADRQFFLRGAALKSVLKGDPQLNVVTLLPKRSSDKKPDSPPSRDDSELSRVIGAFLPWYLLRARFIVGDPAANEIDLGQMFKAAENDIESRCRRPDGMNFEIGLLYFEVLTLKTPPNKADIDYFATNVARKVKPKIMLIDCLKATFASFRLPHLVTLRAHLEQICSTAIEVPGTEGPEALAELYIDLARAVLPVSHADARAYFDRAIDAVSKFGDEMVERWEAVVAVAKRVGKISKSLPEICYRFVRCGEIVGETVHREKYWNRDDVFKTAVHLHSSGAFAALSRWRDRQVGCFGDQLEALTAEAIRSSIISPRVAWGLSGFEGCNGSSQITGACIERENDPSKRQIFFDGAIRDSMLSDASSHAWEELENVSNKFHLYPRDIAKWKNTAEREYPNDTAQTPSLWGNPPQKTCDWENLFKDINLLSPSGLNTAITLFVGLQSGSPRSDFWHKLILRVPAGKEIDFLKVLVGTEDIDFYDWDRAVVSIIQAWAKKAAVKQNWTNFLKQSGKRFAKLFINEYHLRSGSAASYFSDNDAEIIRNSAFEALADTNELIDASTFFAYAGQLSKQLTDDEAGQLLDFALGRFELHIPSDFGDGPWAGWLETPDDSATGAAGLIWSALGSPESSTRWEAAHCVRRLCEHSCQSEIDCLIQLMGDGKTGAFGSKNYPFYELHAKLYSLLALARVALDTTDFLKKHAKVFSEIALRGLPHLLIQRTSSQIALCIERDHPGSFTATVKSKLKNFGKSPFPLKKVKSRPDSIATPWHEDGAIDISLKLHFGHDFDRYWFEPLGRLFGVSRDQLMEFARHIAVNMMGIVDSEEYWRDARQEQWNRFEQMGVRGTWFDHGNYPRIDSYSFYYSYHSLMIAASELIRTVPVIYETRFPSDDDDQLEHWVRRHLPAREDGRWLADRRDPAPRLRRGWIKQGSSKDWLWEVGANDFYDCLCAQSPVPNFICVEGDWTDHSDPYVETISISSALVTTETANSLATAMRTSRDPHSVGFVYYPHHHDMDFTKEPFQLRPWLRIPAEQRGVLDTFDPYARDIHYPPHTIDPSMTKRLGLVVDSECRTWTRKRQKTPVAVSEVWSDRQLSEASHRERPFRSGSRISTSVDLLKELCAKTGKSLIISVEIGRKERDRRHSGKDEDFGYIPPSHKIFIFSHDGILRDAEKNYRLG